MSTRSSALSGARGGTLIEVLLALVVLAVGVTAATQLLVEAFAADSRTLQRERAGMLLSDLSEGAQAIPAAAAAYDTGTYAGAPQSQPCVNQGGCTAAQLAEHQLASWLQHAAGELAGTRDGPAGGSVSSVAGDGIHSLRARLQWGDRGDLTVGADAIAIVADPIPES